MLTHLDPASALAAGLLSFAGVLPGGIALAVAPLLGFFFAGGLYLVARRTVRDRHVYEPAVDRPPARHSSDLRRRQFRAPDPRL